MTDIATLYQSGLSVRKTANATGLGEKKVRLELRRAGLLRTKSEGMYVRYGAMPQTETNPDDVLIIKLKGKTIRSPYRRPLQIFAGKERV